VSRDGCRNDSDETGRRVYDGVLDARAAWRSGVVSTRAEVRHEISTHLIRVPGADQREVRSGRRLTDGSSRCRLRVVLGLCVD
jgi:hypothetical protein